MGVGLGEVGRCGAADQAGQRRARLLVPGQLVVVTDPDVVDVAAAGSEHHLMLVDRGPGGDQPLCQRGEAGGQHADVGIAQIGGGLDPGLPQLRPGVGDRLADQGEGLFDVRQLLGQSGHLCGVIAEGGEQRLRPAHLRSPDARMANRRG